MNEAPSSDEETVLAIRWPYSHSEEGRTFDWDNAFDSLLSFMSHHDPTDDERRPLLSDLAAERLGSAIADEAHVRYDFVWPSVADARRRLIPILDALQARERRAAGAIEAFSYGCLNLHSYHKFHQVLILEWLQALRDDGLDTPGRLIAEIRMWPRGRQRRARPSLPLQTPRPR